ncbi:MAG TPA: hypothetical protein VHQ22_09680 [Terriglobales bacterium]|jgi:photosystem II stability/assembly factor-like uncharacterized protein|nr:hypothetical protein [Terriglobales bacterium]
MLKNFSLVRFIPLCTLLVLLSGCAFSQQLDPNLYNGLRWRMIGPHRGGRAIAVSGIESQPNVYYFGGVGGGVWKTENGGITWKPVFDSQPIASIGAIAVAQSNPTIIYVGTGEADFRSDLTYGNGVYKSTDGGSTWKHIGLEASQHISRIVLDPQNPDVVFVAAMGSAYGPGAERGVFRSTDGGATWQKVLFKDENTGAIDIQLDPDNPKTLWAALVHDQRPPWSAYPPVTTNGAIYKSTDGGITWNPITGGGLPAGDWGRVGLAVARGTHGQRVYALIDTKEGGVFKSDDGGQTWVRNGNDPRLGRLWYFGEIYVDPKNADTVYIPNVSIYRSTDAGKTFVAIKGAPGGDDYHALWIDPGNPQRMIFGSDQGVGVSVDGGGTWSSWYNQPTAQFYHVAVDNDFPYHVYGAQQDSGSVYILSRSNDGEITFRDWHPAGAGESGYIAPDPSDSNIIYGGGTYGELFRYDRRTGQAQVIAPDAIRNFGEAHPEHRFTWTSPVVFSPQDPHTLYFGSQYVLRSSDRGNSWQQISPDLTGADPKASQDGALTVENAKARGHGVVYTIAPSPVSAGQIWAGTDSGLIQLTRDDGKTWNNVTPPGLSDWSKISIIESSHFAAGMAYAAVDRHRLNDIGPYIYRTRDFGKTWTRINNGIPDGAYVRAVREDRIKKGLLFAGTELGVYFSVNDGDSWQPLQLNLPVSPVHDLVIKDNDLVVATHGRAFWILDDISPLRQLTSATQSEAAHLFTPGTAMRIRATTHGDTPIPAEEPAGENPPPGAIFYYYLKSPAQGEVKLEVLDGKGQVVRTYSSKDKLFEPPTPPAFPMYWFKPENLLSPAAGMHRFLWDVRYSAPPVAQPGYSMFTVAGGDVPREPAGPQALPGSYQARLTVNGKTYTQPFKLTMDPRVKARPQDLDKQFSLELKLVQALRQANQTVEDIHAAAQAGKISAEDEKKFAGARRRRGEAEPQGGQQQPAFAQVIGNLGQLIVTIDSADAAPTTQASQAAEKTLAQEQALFQQWEALKRK